MQDLKHVFSYLKPYRRDLFLAVGLVFVECIFEMVIPMLMSDLVDQGVPSHDMQVIMLQGSKMIICAVLALITGLLYARFAARAANGFAAALREAEYRKLQQFDFANLDHFSTPSLVTRMTTDVTVMLNAVATGLRPLVRSPVMLFMGLGMAFLLNAKLTIVFLITTPILAAILAWIVTKVGPLYDRQQTAVDHLNGRVQEALTAIRAIKAFVRGDYENAQFETVNEPARVPGRYVHGHCLHHVVRRQFYSDRPDDGRRADRLFELCSAGAQLGHDVLRRVFAAYPLPDQRPAHPCRAEGAARAGHPG